MDIGLVLCGGMAKGAYQIGALRALENFVPRDQIKYISCASVGVLNGYAFATGRLDDAEEMWKNMCDDDSRFFIGQMLRSSFLQKKIVEIYDSDKHLETTFYTSLLDINNRNVVYKNLAKVDPENIPLYLKASVAMPIYNKSVKIGGKAYFDGAMIDNIPVYPLLKHRLDYVICVYFDDICYKFENDYFDNKIIKLTFPSESVFKQSVMFKKDSIEDMIKNGYDRTMHLLKSVFYSGYEDVESVYGAIEHINRNGKTKGFRVTGDVIVTNLNKVTQKLTKRKIL